MGQQQPPLLALQPPPLTLRAERPPNSPFTQEDNPPPSQQAFLPNPVPALMHPHWPDQPPPHYRKAPTPPFTTLSTTPRSRKCSATPQLYAEAFPHSWEAEEFRANHSYFSVFTPATLHPDYALRTTITPTYVQAAGSGLGKRKNKTNRRLGNRDSEIWG